MVGEQKIESVAEKKVNEYLSGFKSDNSVAASDRPVDDDALDEFLLERAAQQLRAASERLRKLEQSIAGGQAHSPGSRAS